MTFRSEIDENFTRDISLDEEEIRGPDQLAPRVASGQRAASWTTMGYRGVFRGGQEGHATLKSSIEWIF